MDEDQITKMSVTGMLLMTGCSCLLFSFVMKFLDGNPSRFLLLAGFASISIGIIHWVTKIIREIMAIRKKRKNRSYSRS